MKLRNIALFALCIAGALLYTVSTVHAQAPSQFLGPAYAPLNAPSFTGGITVSGQITAVDVQAGTPNFFYWSTRSVMQSPANGNVELTNAARTGFTSLQLGGVTASFPAIAVFGNALAHRQADGTGAVAFSTLTACSSTGEGAMIAVADSTTATWGATITGTGSNHVLAFCDGTNWTVAAK